MATRDDLAQALHGIEIKGKAMPYASHLGNMFAFLDPDGRICLRLSDADRTGFAVTFGARPVVQHGAVMRGYVALPQDMPVAEAQVWGRKSAAHAATLKPKPARPRSS